ncbi:MAG: hypothetical protein L0Y72_17725 [Gemmataceae bacterium]|nr:hypothetical protein [Gemmataceae bacterium]MCI0740892.1 hypothetical protein [Gemmataceae bacterium]
MRRSLLTALVGLFLGAAFGCVWAFWITRMQAAGPSAWNVNNPPGFIGLSDNWAYFFQGSLLGAGFGAVVGSVVGAAGAIVRAIRETNTKRTPPDRPSGLQ